MTFWEAKSLVANYAFSEILGASSPLKLGLREVPSLPRLQVVEPVLDDNETVYTHKLFSVS